MNLSTYAFFESLSWNEATIDQVFDDHDHDDDLGSARAAFEAGHLTLGRAAQILGVTMAEIETLATDWKRPEAA